MVQQRTNPADVSHLGLLVYIARLVGLINPGRVDLLQIFSEVRGKGNTRMCNVFAQLNLF